MKGTSRFLLFLVPVATTRPSPLVGIAVGDVTLQPTVASPPGPGTTLKEVHVTVVEVTGGLPQPVYGETPALVISLRFQMPFFVPLFSVHVTFAVPVAVPSGLLEVIKAPVAMGPEVMANGRIGPDGRRIDELTGVGWRGFTAGF